MGKTRSSAGLAGEGLVRERQLQIPVDPFEIAKGEGIAVFEKPTTGGVSGIFMRVGDEFAIAYAAHLSNEGFQRFSIAHELGHYFLPGHVEHVLQIGGVHESRAGFTSKAPHEVEADEFAAGLLLPTVPFTHAMKDAGEGLGAIEQLAQTCRTSLTATAIRFTDCSRDQIAIVVCGQDNVEYCFMSEAFKEMRGITWLRAKDPIPRRTATYAFVGDPGRISHGERADDSTHIHEWFGGGPDVRLVEEVIGLGRYGKTLTVLTPEQAIDQEEREEEEALVRSWTPGFSGSRRR